MLYIQAQKEGISGGNLVVEKISAKVSVTSNSIHDLNRSTLEIANVINIIQELVSQTSLLALNASIKAASADRHGREFTVVAGEVKQLARKNRQPLLKK